MRIVRAAGILLFSKKMKYFLLMQHPKRMDLPKGHLEKNETYLDGALREFREETALPSSDIEIIEGFMYKETYYPTDKKYNNETVEKHLIIYIARLLKGKSEVKIKTSEHDGFEWRKWNPPHKIQKYTRQSAFNVLLKLEVSSGG